MALKASHIMVSLLIFAGLVTLLANIYSSVQIAYPVIPENTSDDNVLIDLQNLNIQNETKQTIEGFENILAPDSVFDILGGLKAATTGGFEILKTMFTAPLEVLNIANEYLHIPEYIIATVGIILFIYVTFILINIKTQADN